MRFSTLQEREEFYKSEFDICAVAAWLERRRGMKLAMIPGRHTGIVVPRHADNRDNVVVIDDWQNARDIRDYALEYLPEGLYYDRNRYLDVSKCVGCSRGASGCFECNNYDGQQLAFDLDPENVDCPYHGDIGDKMGRKQGLSFCMYEFKVVRRQARDLAQELRNTYENVVVVYSGRGFHVVVDDERAYTLTMSERRSMAARYSRRYAIDEWVTEGGSRLLRLPHSLNGIVSRKCVIIKEERELEEFDPRISRAALPSFARSSRT